MDLWNLFKHPDQFLLAFEGPDAIFVEMDRDAYYRSIFCDRRISPKKGTLTKIRYAELLEFREQHFNKAPNLCYIFHMAHCGSTLLARALDIKDANIVYREPSVLRQLGVEAAATFYGTDAPQDWCRRLNLVTTLLGRSYNESGPVIVKANVPINFIIPQLLATGSDPRSILLYFPLENYLLAILKSPTHRNWIVYVTNELNRGISAITNVRHNLTLPQAAACLWLAQILIFNETIANNPQAKSLNAENLFNNPQAILKHAFHHFGQLCEDATIENIVHGELFTRYSKDPRRQFDNNSRLAQRQILKNELKHEIEEARNWIEQQSDILSIPEKLMNSLTGESVNLLASI